MNKIQGLLNWCKLQTDGYPNVSISNFTTSWRDGLAFSALIHKFKPDLINFHELESINVFYNNYIAFKTAEMHLGIPALLDPKDMSNSECPERLSVITYVSQFYNCLKEMKPEGGYEINKFENTNNDNSDIDTITSRASVHRLTKLKCTICRQKVFLLERYVADDKLYHRKCYRVVQIKNIDNDSEVIGDYLNIYGELKPTMNKGIFVHPIQGMVSTNENIDITTTSPVKIVEDIESDVAESEDSSESLSSFEGSDNDSGENDVSDEDSHLFPNLERSDVIVSDREINEGNENKPYNEDNKNVISEDEYVECPKNSNEDISENRKERTKNEILPSVSQENLIVSISSHEPLTPLKQRLYIKKRDKELPYSTFFEVPDDDLFENRQIGEEPSPIPSSPLNVNRIPENQISQDKEQSCNFKSSSTQGKKLIVIIPDEEYESDVSSIDNEPSISIKPQIVRNSIWRQPIISSISSREKSDSMSLDRKFRDYAEFKEKLEELNSKQSEIEVKARKIQQKLWEENSSTPLHDLLLTKWLDLVEEKDKIFYEENALYSWIKDLKLQEIRLKLEAEIRNLPPSDCDDPAIKEKEKQLVAQIMETVNQRSELVDAMHEENLRRLDIIEIRHQAMDTKDGPSKEHISKKDNPVKHIKKFWKRKTSHLGN